MIVSFEIPGKAVAKGRARAFKTPGGHIGHYTPKKTAQFENLVALAFSARVGGGWTPHEGPVSVTLLFRMAIPKSKPAWWREMAATRAVPHTSRPDLDNMEKAVMDGLNGIAFKDDSQVWKVQKAKEYSARPCVMIVLAFQDEIKRDAANLTLEGI